MENQNNYILIDRFNLNTIKSGLSFADAKKKKDKDIIGYIDVTGKRKILERQEIQLPF